MKEERKQVYVCVSECNTIVKVGITNALNTRITGLKTDQKKVFKLVFCSEYIKHTEAKAVETLVNAKFKENLIKGNEWYNTKAINIIEYLIDDLELKPYTIDEIPSTYECWDEDYFTYKQHKEGKEYPLIKEKPTKGLYCVAFLNGVDVKYAGFCNYGDAKNFYYKYKHFVIMAEELSVLLYGLFLSTYKALPISPRKDIYNIRKKVRAIRQHLLEITDL